VHRRSLGLAVTAVLLATSASAQSQNPPTGTQDRDAAVAGETWFASDRLYYEPLLAEQRAARMSVLFPAWSSEFPHSVKPGTRFAWQVTMGREIPAWGMQSNSAGLERLGEGHWGFGVWIPISFHVIEDFEDESNPIVDTDYRFGTMLKFQAGLPKQWTLSARFVPWAHESTHLGDEYTILAQRKPGFERVNVSYEYKEYGISFERDFGASSDGLVTLRHGGIWLWGDDGYYSNHLLGDPTPTLSASQKNYEPSAGFEYRHPRRGRAGRQYIASVDLRWRLQYSFHHPVSGPERRRPTLTLALGRTALQGDRRAIRSYFLYFTHGVNPFGQLREQYPFRAAGIGWTFL
jgi:hypothetical protein